MSRCTTNRRRPAGEREQRAVLRMRLVGGAGNGLPLDDLQRMAVGIHAALLRLARAGGRELSPAAPSLRAVAIEAHGAALVLEARRGDQLAFAGLAADPAVLDTFADALEALGGGGPLPAGVDETAVRPLRRMLRSLSSYDGVEWTDRRGGEVRRVVVVPAEVAEEAAVTLVTRTEAVEGRLVRVDLRSHRYGIEDDSGEVTGCVFPGDGPHLDLIRPLVGRRVVLTGVAHRDREGRVHRFRVDHIAPARPPVAGTPQAVDS